TNSAFIAAANPQTMLKLLDEIEHLGTLVDGYKTANEEAQEQLNELHELCKKKSQRSFNDHLIDQCIRLNAEADWLASQLQTTWVIDGKSKARCLFGPGKWREAARKAIEHPEEEAPVPVKTGPKWAWASGKEK
ncbi:MAG: ead/Ea22-like family protein, partial [Clostridia bacterium]|nr:ead/Ea22-like family protein [Clostridia bacterium]